MILSPDAFWDWMKVRWPRLAHWDVIRDQSHMHHTLVTILGFGAFGMVESIALRAPWSFVITTGLAAGILGGLAGYVIRESRSRIMGHERKVYELWDGVLDVLVPVMIAGPWALSAYFGTVPTWSGPTLYLAASVVAWMYSFGRPLHALHYDWGKDPEARP